MWLKAGPSPRASLLSSPLFAAGAERQVAEIGGKGGECRALWCTGESGYARGSEGSWLRSAHAVGVFVDSWAGWSGMQVSQFLARVGGEEWP